MCSYVVTVNNYPELKIQLGLSVKKSLMWLLSNVMAMDTGDWFQWANTYSIENVFMLLYIAHTNSY